MSAALVGAATWGRPSATSTPEVAEAGRSQAAFERERSSILRDAPAAQQDALADGVVTTAEYEAAVRSSMRCLREDLAAARPAIAAHPPEFTGPAWTDDRFSFVYDYRLLDDELDPRPYDRSCQQRTSRSVEALFHVQRWADRAYLERTGRAFHACLDAASLPGDAADGPRSRFRSVITDPTVDDQGAIEARKCIGAHPSIGDLNP